LRPSISSTSAFSGSRRDWSVGSSAFCLLLASVVLIWRAGAALAAGAAALPLAGEVPLPGARRLPLDCRRMGLCVALIGLLGAAWSLFRAPSKPIAAAVWKIVGDLLPPLILIFLVLGTIFQASPRRPKGERWVRSARWSLRSHAGG